MQSATASNRGYEFQQLLTHDPTTQKSPFTGGKRMNVISIIACLLLPWGVFTLTSSVLSFAMRYEHPTMAWGIVANEAFLVLWCGHLARVAYHRRVTNDPNREPSWYIFLFVTTLLAWGLGIIHGSVIYGGYMRPYYDITNLSSYQALDVNKVPGGLALDAGYIMFNDKTYIDRSKFASFTNKDMYCVAPIVSGDNALPSYDFWAVGLNCCEGSSNRMPSPEDFNCGEISNPYARAGLRLMDDAPRQYYNLAVQQAEAQFGIQAKTPLFFDWVEDPLDSLNKQSSDGFMYHTFGILSFLGLQLFLVVLCVVLFWQYWSV